MFVYFTIDIHRSIILFISLNESIEMNGLYLSRHLNDQPEKIMIELATDFEFVDIDRLVSKLNF